MILVGNLPDIGSTPLYFGTEKQSLATEIITEFNESLALMLDGFESQSEVTIVQLDVKSYFKEINENPEIFGFKNVSESYLPMDYIDFSHPLQTNYKNVPNEVKGKNPDEYTYWWTISPTKKIHDIISKKVLNALLKLDL